MGAGNVRLDTESNEGTMDFVERILNGGEKKNPGAKSNINERMADKLDTNLEFNINLPSIPAYEGIQRNFMTSEPQKSQFLNNISERP